MYGITNVALHRSRNGAIDGTTHLAGSGSRRKEKNAAWLQATATGLHAASTMVRWMDPGGTKLVPDRYHARRTCISKGPRPPRTGRRGPVRTSASAPIRVACTQSPSIGHRLTVLSNIYPIRCVAHDKNLVSPHDFSFTHVETYATVVNSRPSVDHARTN